MNADIQYREEDIKKYNREVYVRLARESCLKNYYGGQMGTRDEILREVEEKRRSKEQNGEMSANVIPYDEERWLRAESRSNSDGTQGKWKKEQPVVHMNADIINQRLMAQTIQQPGSLESYNLMESHEAVTGDTTRLPSLEVVREPGEDELPNSQDILRMSGIETEPMAETHSYVEDFTQTYHNDEPSNFLTSIRNVEPEDSEENAKKKLSPEEKSSFGRFALRCIISLLLLSGLIAADKMKYEFQGLDAGTVYENISSTEFLDEISEWVMVKIGK